jgi:hypothetical protein
MGVPLQIVDKPRLIKLLNKMFGAGDTSAHCDVEFYTGSPDSAGNIRVEVTIKSKVNGAFARAFLKGNNPDNYSSVIDEVKSDVK